MMWAEHLNARDRSGALRRRWVWVGARSGVLQDVGFEDTLGAERRMGGGRHRLQLRIGPRLYVCQLFHLQHSLTLHNLRGNVRTALRLSRSSSALLEAVAVFELVTESDFVRPAIDVSPAVKVEAPDCGRCLGEGVFVWSLRDEVGCRSAAARVAKPLLACAPLISRF